MKCEYELVCAQNEWLASVHLLDETEAHVQPSEQTLKQERDALKTEMHRRLNA